MEIKKFTFNSFQENTYVISSNKKCMIIDPGCSNKDEREILHAYITNNNLEPVELVNTHCHLDHIFGNNYITKTYQLKPKMHIKDLPLLEKSLEIAELYNVDLEEPPMDVEFVKEGDFISVGETNWEVIFTPGHAPGHICLLNIKNKKIIVGDVLFYLSIGRTDLPGCNHNDLINSIKNKLFCLDDDIEVICGHGHSTFIGFEKQNNPFLKE
jgi:hydroxyacylglutathione hydrolase